MSGSLIMFVRITPKPEHLAAARQAILGILPETRAEAGCRSFVLHEDTDACGRLYLYEAWKDEAALAALHDQPYTGLVFNGYREWLAESIESTVMREVV